MIFPLTFSTLTGGVLHFLFTQISAWPLMFARRGSHHRTVGTSFSTLQLLPLALTDPKHHTRLNYSALPKQALQPHADSHQACPELALFLSLRLTLIFRSLWPTCSLSTFLLRCVTLPWVLDMIRIQIITSLTSKLLPLLMQFKITLTFLFSSSLLHM